MPSTGRCNVCSHCPTTSPSGPRTAPVRSAPRLPAVSAPAPSAPSGRGTHSCARRSEDSFVAELIGSLGSYPPYFRRLGEANRLGPAVLPQRLDLEPMTPTAVAAAQAGGATIVDVRSVAEFASAHVPGALSIELRPAFATLARLARRPRSTRRPRARPGTGPRRGAVAGGQDRLREHRRRARRRHRRLDEGGPGDSVCTTHRTVHPSPACGSSTSDRPRSSAPVTCRARCTSSSATSLPPPTT